MTDKQIIIDYKKLCENYSKEVGCYNTFDGSCIKEQCFTYRLLQLLKAKEQECEELKKNVEHWKMEYKEAKAKGEWTYDLVKKRLCEQLDQLKQTLAEIEEIAEDFYLDGEYVKDKYLAQEILQKISECEVKR